MVDEPNLNDVPVTKGRALAMGAQCWECPLRDNDIAYGSGVDDAKYVIVGEAPGAKEIKSGVPFIGPSGRLLDKILAHHGIDRETDVYITNTVLCRPPLKDGKNTPPNVKAVRACRNRLVNEIKAHVPDAVLALGGPAAKAILNTTKGITELRVGGAKQSELIDLPVVATFHPAAALRSPDKYPSIVSDVGKLANNIGHIGWEPTRYDVIDDYDDAQFAIALQAKYPLVTMDIEYRPPFNRHHPDFLCIGTTHEEGHAYVFSERVCNDLRFRKLLARAFEETRWGFQNGKGDIQRLWGAGITNARVDEDSLLAHALTDERKGTHSLEQLATEFLGAPNYKTEAKAGLEDEQDLSFLPKDILYRYQAMDSDMTHRLHPILRREMLGDDVLRVYEKLVIPGTNSLAKAEFMGISIDLDYLDELDQELSEQLIEREKNTAEWVANPRSPKQIKQAFGEILREDFEGSTNKLALEALIEKDPTGEVANLARAVLEYREAHKEHSTYVKGMRKHVVAGRIHTQFNLHIAETGRLSSSKPNLQNIKHGRLRQMFVADEGHKLVSADYSAIELRIASIFYRELGDPWLYEQFINGRPLHKEMATRLFGPHYSEIQYVKGKTTTFSILYEVFAKSLAARLHTSVREAQKLIDGWKANVPGLERYWKQTRDEIMAQGYLRSFYGRLRRFWLITNENKHDVFKEGYNFKIQSPASDICLRALNSLAPITMPVVTVHDSLTFLVPDDEVEFQSKLIQRTMEDVPDWDVPFPVELKVGDRWS